MIDFHGSYKPTGLQRTCPNAINFEEVHGLEELKWAEKGTDQGAKDYKLESKGISSDEKLKIHMAPDGGFVVKITK